MWIFNVGRDVEFDLRNELLRRIHLLGPAFFRSMPTGQILSRAISDLGQVRLLVGFAGLNVVNSTLAFASAIALMVAIDWELTLYTLVSFPLLIGVTRGFGKAMYQRSLASQAALAKLVERATENVAGVRLVRAMAIEGVRSIGTRGIGARGLDRLESADAEIFGPEAEELLGLREVGVPIARGWVIPANAEPARVAAFLADGLAEPLPSRSNTLKAWINSSSVSLKETADRQRQARQALWTRRTHAAAGPAKSPSPGCPNPGGGTTTCSGCCGGESRTGSIITLEGSRGNYQTPFFLSIF